MYKFFGDDFNKHMFYNSFVRLSVGNSLVTYGRISPCQLLLYFFVRFMMSLQKKIERSKFKISIGK